MLPHKERNVSERNIFVRSASFVTVDPELAPLVTIAIAGSVTIACHSRTVSRTDPGCMLLTPGMIERLRPHRPGRPRHWSALQPVRCRARHHLIPHTNSQLDQTPAPVLSFAPTTVLVCEQHHVACSNLWSAPHFTASSPVLVQVNTQTSIVPASYCRYSSTYVHSLTVGKPCPQL